MFIDWFTFGAQILNFLILVYLLKRFLYAPIINTMDSREQKISARFREAGDRKKQAEQEAEALGKQRNELEARRREIIGEAKEEAGMEKQKLMQQARQETEAIREKWREALKKEKNAFLDDLKRMTAEQVYEITRQVFKDLFHEQLERRAIEVFLDQLSKVDQQAKRKLTAGLDQDNRLVVSSRFEISPAMRKKITRAVHTHIQKDVEVSYTISSDLIMGVQLSTQGHKLGWTVETFLRNMEKQIENTFESEAQKGNSAENNMEPGEENVDSKKKAGNP